MSFDIFPQSLNVGFNKNQGFAPVSHDGLHSTENSSYSKISADPEKIPILKLVSDDISKENGSSSNAQDEASIAQVFGEDTVEISGQQADRKVQYDYDFETKKIVTKIVDSETNEEIKQIPDERLRKIYQGLEEFDEQISEVSSEVGAIGDQVLDETV